MSEGEVGKPPPMGELSGEGRRKGEKDAEWMEATTQPPEDAQGEEDNADASKVIVFVVGRGANSTTLCNAVIWVYLLSNVLFTARSRVTLRLIPSFILLRLQKGLWRSP